MKLKMLFPFILVLSFSLCGSDSPLPSSDNSETDLPRIHKSDVQVQRAMTHRETEEGDNLIRTKALLKRLLLLPIKWMWTAL